VSPSELVNICVHGIGKPGRPLEPGEHDYWVDEPQFVDILDAVATVDGVRLSFDDGNRSDVDVALAALVDRDLQATFYIIAGRLEQPGSLGAADLRTLLDSGMTIGSHGMNHVPWRALPPEIMRDELLTARRVIEEAGECRVEVASLPLGRYDRGVLRELRRTGYAQVSTSDRRLAQEGAWLQHRFSLHVRDTPESVLAAVAAARRRPKRLRRAAVGVVKRWR
jgi:peptidoglycan/xylan/chitin deacetylase (PgdA/CDA1 family)